MRIEIDVAGATLRLAELTDTDAEHPFLVSVGSLRMAARAGHLAGLGVGESPNLDVLLQNNKRQAIGLLGTPLRAPVRVYDKDGSLFFDGIVSKVALGKTLTLSIES